MTTRLQLSLDIRNFIPSQPRQMSYKCLLTNDVSKAEVVPDLPDDAHGGNN